MRPILFLPLILAGLAATAAAAQSPDADVRLLTVNALARVHYAHAKDATLAGLSPIIVVDADSATLIRNGERRREIYLPARYRSLKSLAHVALGLYSLLAPHADREDGSAWRADLAAYRAQVATLVPLVGELGLHWDDAKRQREMLAAALAFMDKVLTAGRVGRAELHAYADDVGPALLGNAYDASEAELKALDALIRSWRGELSAEEWARLYVVVLGPARPRERHPALDYFARLLGKDAAARLIEADNVADVAGGLDLLATTVNDRRMAADFFGDPARFDHGLLRDATARHLDKMFAPSPAR